MQQDIQQQRHTPERITLKHAEQALTGFNIHLALAITRGLGTMPCAYFFMVLALVGFPGFGATPQQYVQWLSQTFIQLVALSVLAVGQTLLGKHAELQAEEQYQTTLKMYHDMERVIQYLQQLAAQGEQHAAALQTVVETRFSEVQSLLLERQQKSRRPPARQKKELDSSHL